MFVNDRTDELSRRKRELRLRIGRQRRRIDARLRGARDQARQLVSWRLYAARYPGLALAAALGVGLTASSLLRPRRVARLLGNSLLRRAFGAFQERLWNEVRRGWTEKP